jgi:hypothetical protein
LLELRSDDSLTRDRANELELELDAMTEHASDLEKVIQDKDLVIAQLTT